MRTGTDSKEGWGWPSNSRKAHWFDGGIALCGKWMFMGLLERGNDGSRDNCAECRRKRAAAEQKAQATGVKP